jgi:hypothetical protein
VSACRSEDDEDEPMSKTATDLMVWTWAGWEPLQFYRRLGGFHEQQEGDAHWASDWSRLLHSERTARALRAAGINWVTTHFFKGFGLEAEADEIADTARLIRNFHRHGVRVFAYLQYGTIVPETIETEEPAAREWGRRDWNGRHDGHPYEYGAQYWRRKPCANQPGFREYLLRGVDRAVAIGADGIWVDNLNSDGCHCPACQDAFRAYLARTVRNPARDLGVRDLAAVTIPRAERPREPLFQAWIRFRCDEVGTSLRRIAEHARARQPGILVAANIGLGSHQRHTLDNGNWLSNLGVLDYTYAENGLFPAWTGDRIVSQHFPMKSAVAAGTRVVPGASPGGRSRLYPRPALPTPRQLRRVFAESALMGAHAVGGPWGLRGENAGAAPILLRDAAHRRTQRALVERYAAWQRHFAGSTDAAPVALLYSFEAVTCDEPASRAVLDAMAQLLRQQQVPFRYVLSDRLEALDGLRLLALPHVLPMSDALVARLRAFVRRGGRLLATGRTSLYDAQMRMRRDYALADVFGAHFSNAFEDAHHDGVVANPRTGCVLLPGEWGLKLDDGSPACRISNCRLMVLVRRALAGAGLPEVFSPLPHVGYEVRRTAGGGWLLGLLNYGDAPVHGIEIRLPPDWHAARLRTLEPTRDEAWLPCRRIADGGRAVTISELDVEIFLVTG